MKKAFRPRKMDNRMPSPESIFLQDKGYLDENVYSYLRNAILRGRFSPGARLVQEALARELGVSRTPVRESLRRLEREGLIEHVPNRGFKLPQEIGSHMLEIFEIRAILEGYILRVVCEKTTDALLSDLKSFVKKAQRYLIQSKIEELHRLNTLFHDQIMEQVPGREHLKGYVKDLREYILRFRLATLRAPGAAQRMLEDHQRIILALEIGDSDLCERIMRDHIERAKIDAIRSLPENGGEWH